MTVKEGGPAYIGPYKMAKLNPLLTSEYHKYLINDKFNNNCVQAWDLMMDNNLSKTLMSLKKALDKKNGIDEPEYDSKNLYHTQIDL